MSETLTIPNETVLFVGMLGFTAVLFWALCASMNALAAKHERFRLRQPVRVAIGSGLIWAVFALWCALCGEMKAAVALLLLYVAAGVPVLVAWQLSDEAPREVYDSAWGKKRLSNRAKGYNENTRVLIGHALDRQMEANEVLRQAIAQMVAQYELTNEEDVPANAARREAALTVRKEG